MKNLFLSNVNSIAGGNHNILLAPAIQFVRDFAA